MAMTLVGAQVTEHSGVAVGSPQSRNRGAPMKRHSPILTHVLFSLSVAAGLLCAAPGASAQTAQTAVIPFAFSANGQQLPAGTYEVRLLSKCILSLYSANTNTTQLLMVHTGGGGVIETQGRLVFHRDGTNRDLMQIRVPGTSFYSELEVQPRFQRASAKNTPADSSFEIAMK
jgi:hypothetical protein